MNITKTIAVVAILFMFTFSILSQAFSLLQTNNVLNNTGQIKSAGLVWDRCETLQSSNGPWSVTYGGKVQTTTDTPYEGQRCLRITTPGQKVWNIWLQKDAPDLWNFQGKEIMTFAYRTNHQTCPLRFALWDEAWNAYEIMIGTLPSASWNLVSVDMRLAEIPDISRVIALNIVVDPPNGQMVPADYKGDVDMITLEQPTTELPLRLKLSPLSAAILPKENSTFTALAKYGHGSITLQWYLDDQLITPTTPTSYTYVAPTNPLPGENHTVRVVAKDQSVPPQSVQQTGTIFIAPPIIPAQPLHCEGAKIVNSNGTEVKLVGVNQVGYNEMTCGFWHEVGGDAESGQGPWNAQYEEHVKAHLRQMHAMGFNSLRLHLVASWTIDTLNAYNNWRTPDPADLPQIDTLKRTLDLAQQYGIYVILEGFSLVRAAGGTDGGGAVSLPYPPYDNGAGIFANAQDFATRFWGFLAQQLRGYPNAIFEIWNEFGGDYENNLNDFKEGMKCAKLCIDAMRGNNYTGLIVLQWGYSWDLWWVDHIPQSYGGINNINSTILGDPNVVFSQHVYDYPVEDSMDVLSTTTRTDTAFWDVGDVEHACNGAIDQTNSTQLEQRFAMLGYDHVVNDRRHPILIGEIGSNSNFWEQTHGDKMLASALEIINRKYNGWNVFVWDSESSWAKAFAMFGPVPWIPSPNLTGQITINAAYSLLRH